ncbi:MAG: hypothetical protein ABGZ37_06175 [Akkermansiaceae bacterium]
MERYNLEQDPAETIDLARKYPGKAGALATLMETARTDSPQYAFKGTAKKKKGKKK